MSARDSTVVLSKTQFFPLKTSSCAVYLLSGLLLLEAILDTRIATLLHMVEHTANIPLTGIDLYQIV